MHPSKRKTLYAAVGATVAIALTATIALASFLMGNPSTGNTWTDRWPYYGGSSTSIFRVDNLNYGAVNSLWVFVDNNGWNGATQTVNWPVWIALYDVNKNMLTECLSFFTGSQQWINCTTPTPVGVGPGTYWIAEHSPAGNDPGPTITNAFYTHEIPVHGSPDCNLSVTQRDIGWNSAPFGGTECGLTGSDQTSFADSGSAGGDTGQSWLGNPGSNGDDIALPWWGSPQGIVVASEYRAASNRTFTNVALYVDATNTSSAIELGVYVPGNSTPGVRPYGIGQPGARGPVCVLSNPHAGAWNACALNGSVTPIPGLNLYLFYDSLNSGGVARGVPHGDCSQVQLIGPYILTPPDPWSGTTGCGNSHQVLEYIY